MGGKPSWMPLDRASVEALGSSYSYNGVFISENPT